MSRFLFFIAAICFVQTAKAQSWQWGARGGGGSNGSGGNIAETVVDMTTDKAGNVYVLAKINTGVPITITGLPNAILGFGNEDILIVSYDCAGNYKWKKIIGGSSGDAGMAIGCDTLGSVFVVGGVTPVQPPFTPANFDTDTIFNYSNIKTFFVVRYDTAGNFKWLRQPTPDTVPNIRQFRYMPRDMIVNPNGDIEILCHLSPGLLSGSNIVVDTPSAYILRYNKDGNITGLVKPDLNWRQVAGDGMAQTSLYSIRMAKTKTGKYILSGAQNFQTFPPYSDPLVIGGEKIVSRIFVALFDNNWQSTWKKYNDSSSTSQFYYRPVIGEDLNIYLAGPTKHGQSFNGYHVGNNLTTSAVPFMIKLDSLGNLIYGKNASSNASSGAAGIAINDSKVFLAGDFPGKLVWDNLTLENLPNIGYDIFLASFDKNSGSVLRLDSLKGNSGYPDKPTTLISDSRNNIYLGGEMGSNFTIGSSNLQSAGGNSDFFIAKYGTANCSGTPVPVRLLTFTAALQQQAVLTQWQTAQEQNTKAFIIERSSNAQRFDSIGTVAAKGNSNVHQSYNFTDHSPYSPLTTHHSLYYRLKIVDLDGSYAYSPVDKVNLSGSKGISIYPNPARTTAVITYTLPNDARQAVVELYNTMGQRIDMGREINLSGTGSKVINIAHLPAGIYHVVVRSKGMIAGSEKLVVER